MNKTSNIKITFCPGPGAVLPEWHSNQKEFFGRGDFEYKKLKLKTINWIKKISGQDEVIPVAGAGTTAAIVALNTFLTNKILVINTGYYAARWLNYLKKIKKFKKIKEISYEEFIKQKSLNGYKWVLFVYVETAACKKFDLKLVKKFAIKRNKNLWLMLQPPLV